METIVEIYITGYNIRGALMRKIVIVVLIVTLVVATLIGVVGCRSVVEEESDSFVKELQKVIPNELEQLKTSQEKEFFFSLIRTYVCETSLKNSLMFRVQSIEETYENGTLVIYKHISSERINGTNMQDAFIVTKDVKIDTYNKTYEVHQDFHNFGNLPDTYSYAPNDTRENAVLLIKYYGKKDTNLSYDVVAINNAITAYVNWVMAN